MGSFGSRARAGNHGEQSERGEEYLDNSVGSLGLDLAHPKCGSHFEEARLFFLRRPAGRFL
jgi:hypothetical protein